MVQNSFSENKFEYSYFHCSQCESCCEQSIFVNKILNSSSSGCVERKHFTYFKTEELNTERIA